MPEWIPVNDVYDLFLTGQQLREYQGVWNIPQCQTVGASDRCRNEAKYILFVNDEELGECCDQCLPSWINTYTKNNRSVTVDRLPTYRGE